MDLAALISEAEKLTRTGTLLVPNGSGVPAAIWHGLMQGEPCISVRRPNGWLVVIPDDHDSGEVRLATDTQPPGVPLFAEPYRSLPPPDALFKYGSPAVERYLKAHGWDRDEPLNPNFPDSAAHEYERLWQKNCPMYSDAAWAVLGGWNFPWPGRDSIDRSAQVLVAWTTRDCEPWLEVFETDGRFIVLQRIT